MTSIACAFLRAGRDCQHRAEVGCALYRRIDCKGNPIVADFSEVLGARASIVYEAASALLDDDIRFVIGGRDAVNVYCPESKEETWSTDIFIRSEDRDRAWRALSRRGFRMKSIDPTCCSATKSGVSVELHYGMPPDKPEYVDEETFKRAAKVKLRRLHVSIQPLEELIAYKADRYAERDKVDLRRIMASWREKIDVEYLEKVLTERRLSPKVKLI